MKQSYDIRKSTCYKNNDNNSNIKPLPKLYENRENCCGCSVCYAICPANAILMEADEEGYIYPTVDAEKCVRCYLCISACVFKSDQESRGYIAKGGNM